MEKFNLKVENRELGASRDSKNLRGQGMIPAELYGGHSGNNTHLAVNAIEFEKVLRQAGESTIIELDFPDGSKRSVLIKDVAYHYLNGQPIHVDFFEVVMTEKLTATVQIEFVGESEAVRVLNGTLVQVLSEVEVECLPADLPSHFEVDISVLKTFDDAITVADIPHSDKVEIKAEAEEVVAKVQEPRDMEAEMANDVVDEAAAVAAAVGPEPEAGAEGEEATEDKK
jgi:large subunit ribosomal protein L25